MKTIKELMEESNGHTRLLYEIDHWDVPLKGVMLWEGERRYFVHTESKRVFDGEESEYYYKVYHLPDQLMEKIETRYDMFRRFVGTQCDFNYSGKRGIGSRNGNLGDLMPYHHHEKFYKNESLTQPIQVDYSECKLVGEFKL